MDLDKFAAVLAERLSKIVPAGFHIAAADGMLWYTAEQGRFPGQLGNYDPGRSGTYVRSNFGLYGATNEENVVGVAVQALNELQDYISEATHVPWPGTTRQPDPHGHIRDAVLHLWYGTEDDIILACEPIRLADIN
ncbi:MAG TPA: hypothetical protein VGS19_08630 [Streptosporangiaceae bacterium]|nr:hypothetical protein [Streptosporangiaceae bacterium]